MCSRTFFPRYAAIELGCPFSTDGNTRSGNGAPTLKRFEASWGVATWLDASSMVNRTVRGEILMSLIVTTKCLDKTRLPLDREGS